MTRLQVERNADMARKGGDRQPLVTVVLLNCRAEEEADTLDCVRSLEASDYAALETIVVDNGSPGGVADRLAAALPDVTILRTGANLGFTGGNNRGIELALGSGCDYVLALNNDTVVEPDCVRRLVETAESDPRIGCVGGKILYHDAPDRIWFGGGRFCARRGLGIHHRQHELDAPGEGEPSEEVTFLTGCCMLLSAEALRSAGAFAEDFFIYVEDAELSLRLREAGYRLLYQPAARLYHRVPLEEPPIPPHKIVLRDRNRRRLMRRRFGLASRAIFALFFYSTRSLHAGGYLVRRDWPRLRAIWQGMTAP